MFKRAVLSVGRTFPTTLPAASRCMQSCTPHPAAYSSLASVSSFQLLQRRWASNRGGPALSTGAAAAVALKKKGAQGKTNIPSRGTARTGLSKQQHTKNTVASSTTVLNSYVRDLRQGSRQDQILHHGSFQQPRVGGQAFDTELLRQFTSMFAKDFECLPTQQTTAVCLVGASGVGKTRAALSFPSAISVPADMSCFTAYIGFGTDPKLRLSGAELAHLSRATEGTEDTVAQVILTRVLASIVLLHRHRKHLDPLPGRDAKPIMKFDHDATLLEVSSDNLRQRVVEEIVALAAEEKAPKVAILVNVDEAQLFDELVFDKQGNPEGARLCMKVLRGVQEAVFVASKGKCVCLGLATGINPQLVLSSTKRGENRPITTELLSRDEFTQLARDSWPGKKHVDVFAAAAFPRVRQMLREMGLRSADFVPDSPDQALLLINHAMAGTELSRKDIPTQVHAVGSLTAAKPILDIAVWPSLLAALREKLFSVGALPWAPDVSFGNKVASSCFNFENSAFQVIGFTLELFWDPHPAVAKIRKSFSEINPIFAHWASWKSTPKGMFSCQRVALQDKLHHHHPFKRCTGTIRTACQGPLSEQVKSQIGNLEKGSAVFFQLGGGSSSYILMIRDGRGRIHVRYADSGATATTTSKSIEAEAKKLADKAKMVHEGLTRCLSKLASPLVLDPEYNIAMVTNTKSDCCDGGVVQLGGGTTKKVFVLGPDTFKFSPWTDMLFRCTPNRSSK